MTGIEILLDKLGEKGYTIGSANISNSDSNGDFEITNLQGRSTTQNYKRIAETFGSLSFFHFSAEEAIDQIINMIEMQIDIEPRQNQDR